MQKTFDNKLVLVTGGAGALGQGVVSWYSDRGARVAVLDYSDEILASAFPNPSEMHCYEPATSPIETAALKPLDALSVSLAR